MKVWRIMATKYPSRCQVCEARFVLGEDIAWHPETKQHLHYVCFMRRFHWSNTATAMRVQ